MYHNIDVSDIENMEMTTTDQSNTTSLVKQTSMENALRIIQN